MLLCLPKPWYKALEGRVALSANQVVQHLRRTSDGRESGCRVSIATLGFIRAIWISARDPSPVHTTVLDPTDPAYHSPCKVSSVKLRLGTPSALEQFVSKPVDLEDRHLYLWLIKKRAVLVWSAWRSSTHSVSAVQVQLTQSSVSATADLMSFSDVAVES